MLKKFSLVLLSMLLLFSFSSVVGANPSNEIVEVSPERTDRIFELYERRDNLIRSGIIGEEIAKINDELIELGVTVMSPAEVMQKYGDEPQIKDALNLYSSDSSFSIDPRVVGPNYPFVEWKSFRSKFWKDGILYDVQHLTATPNGESAGALMGNMRTSVQYSDSFQVGVTNLVATVAKEGYTFLVPKADNVIKIYEAVADFIKDANFSKTSTLSDVQMTYKTDYVQWVDYMFVKQDSQDDIHQVLAFTTNEVKGNSRVEMPAHKFDGSGSVINPGTKDTLPVNFYYEATKHRDGMQAVASYLDPSQPRTSLVDKIEIKGLKGEIVQTIHISTPSSPGLIY